MRTNYSCIYVSCSLRCCPMNKMIPPIKSSKLDEIRISIDFSGGGSGITGELDDIPAHFTDNGIGYYRELVTLNLNGLELNRDQTIKMIGEAYVIDIEREASDDRNPKYEYDKPFMADVL